MVNDWLGMHHTKEALRNRDKAFFTDQEQEVGAERVREGIIRVRPLHPQCNYNSAASGPSAVGNFVPGGPSLGSVCTALPSL